MSDFEKLYEEHILDGEGSCWCAPYLEYTDPVTGARVWVHRDKDSAN